MRILSWYSILHFFYFYFCIIDSQSQTVSRKEQSCLEINVKINYRDGVDRIQVWSNLGKSYTVKNKNEGTLYYVDECLNPKGCYLLELRGSFEYTIDNIKNQTAELFDDGDLLYIGDTCPSSFCGPFKDDLWVLSYTNSGNLKYTWDYSDEQFSGTLEAGYNTIFCVDKSSDDECYTIEGAGSGYYYQLDQGNIADQGFLTYASSCVDKCNAHPLLADTNRGQDITLIISAISTMAALTDVESPQYEAACWIIHDDVARLEPTNPTLLQRYIAALLYYSTGGEQWDFADEFGYLSPKSECDWNARLNGIICNNSAKNDSNITQIILRYNNLQGQIPDELYWLTHLENLDMYGNNLSGTISPSIELLVNLKRLSLPYNSLSGSLPICLSQLTKLTTLSLQNNKFNGQLYLPKSIETARLSTNEFSGSLDDNFWNASSLKIFDGSYNNFIDTIPTSIANLKELVSFTLRSNEIEGTIPSQIFAISSLMTLNLFDNNLIGAIPNEISEENSMRTLILSQNNLNGTIGKSISKLTQLSHLLLSDNQLTGSFPSELITLQDLSILQIENNDITGTIPFEDCTPSYRVDCSVTCNCCASCFGLFSTYVENAYQPPSTLELKLITPEPETLVIGYITIVNNASQTIAEYFDIEAFNEIKYNVSISTTDCYQIRSKGTSAQGNPLVQELHINGKLLSTEYGNSEGIVKQTIGYSSKLDATAIGTCDNYQICNRTLTPVDPIRHLVNIVTRFTNINDIVAFRLDAICWWIKDLEIIAEDNEDELDNDALVQRYLLALLYYTTDGSNWDNKEKWLGRESVCDWYGIFCDPDTDTVINEIKLLKNNLVGTIPSELGQLQKLQVLSLQENNLSETFPQGMANSIHLRHINLSKNKFIGTINPSFKNLKLLEYLDISENLFSSTVPSSFGRLPSLKTLKASDNAFSSALPNDFYKLRNLVHLALANNFLEGEVTSLQMMNKLEHLDLSANYFSGSLPIFGEKQTILKVLDLSQNGFDGVISKSIGSMSSLKELYLYNNGIIGTIPSAIGNTTSLERVSFAYNSIKGTVPSEINKLKKLSLLHLHNNDLTGTIVDVDIDIENFISDCGNSSTSPADLNCFACTTCCNDDGACLEKSQTWPPQDGISPTTIGVGYTFTLTVISFFVLFMFCLLLSCCGISRPKLPFKARDQFQTDSIYRFFLSSSPIAHIFAFLGIALHTWILFSFLQAADFTNRNNEWVYSTSCPDNDLYCVDQLQITPMGWVTFGFLLATFLIPDFLDAIFLLWESILLYDIKGMYGATMVFYITAFSTVCSVIYNYATGSSDTVIYLNAGILLFLNDLDNQILSILSKVAPRWIEKIEDEIAAEDLHSLGSLSISIDDESAARMINSSKSKSVSSQLEDSPHSVSNASSFVLPDKEKDKLRAEIKDLKKKQKVSSEKINALENSNNNQKDEYAQLRKDYADMKQMVEKLRSDYNLTYS